MKTDNEPIFEITDKAGFIRLIFSLIIAAIGYGLIWMYTSGWVALGVSLVVWSNNITKKS